MLKILVLYVGAGTGLCLRMFVVKLLVEHVILYKIAPEASNTYFEYLATYFDAYGNHITMNCGYEWAISESWSSTSSSLLRFECKERELSVCGEASVMLYTHISGVCLVTKIDY